MSQDFALTIPFEKSEKEDGWYITGIAAGTDIDLMGERIAPTAIARFVEHINTNGPIPFKDWHQKNTVTAEIGEVVKAWIEPNFQMGVEVKLDEDHPTASLVWKKLAKGKQYGMSVHGKVLEYKDEFDREISKSVRTFYNVIIDEISLTTRPVWTPSLGTVLSKAVDESQDGDTTSMSEETPTVEETTAPADSTDETNGTEKPEATSVESSEPENETPDVEKAVSSKTVTDARTIKKILGMHREMSRMLADLVIASGDEADEDSDASETVTETSKAAQPETQSDELTKALDEITGLRNEIVELRGLIATTPIPPVLTKSENESFDEAVTPLKGLDKMRFGLAGIHPPTERN